MMQLSLLRKLFLITEIVYKLKNIGDISKEKLCEHIYLEYAEKRLYSE